MSKRMNETATAKVFGFPTPYDGPHTDDEYQEPKPTRIQRLLYNAYITNMAGTTAPPRTPVNWTVITGLCAVGTFILVLLTMVCAATWFISAQSQHILDMETQTKRDKEAMELRISKAEADAAEAKKFGIYAAAGSDEKNGHKPNQEKK
jgi:hypothetical protein